jgi:chitin disaccharide deacetylase
MQLIVNADDFGLTPGVNRAIAELHTRGVLTSSTLMARANATEDAIQIARATPSLGVGCHLVLVDGMPVLSASRNTPHLADPVSGHFKPGLAGFLKNLYGSRSSFRFRGSRLEDTSLEDTGIEQQIEVEAKAQIEFLQGAGLNLTHIDTHKHTHMFPRVLRPVLRAARASGIRAVRNPFEPAWAVRATAGANLARVAEVGLLRWLQPVWRKILTEEGFATTHGTIAVVGTGVLNSVTLRRLLQQLPAGTWELVTHPGYNDADLARIRTRLRASREIECEALAVIKEFPDIELISFRDLRPPAGLQ